MVSDTSSFPSLTRRQEEILALIIRAYSQSAEPVSSKHLLEAFGLQVSSATVRNEMAVLEDLGLISAPHTSAGRVPTESGYRYFVHFLVQASDLPSAEARQISTQLQNAPLATEQWMHTVASALARAAHTAALVTPPSAPVSRFRHIELISVQGRLLLMVLVLSQGAVHQQMLTLAEPVPQQRLSEAAATLNSLCADATASEVRVRCGQLPTLERELAELCSDLMQRSVEEQMQFVYRDGLTGLVGSMPHQAVAQQAVRVVEERGLLSGILSEMLAENDREVRVVIAGNGRWEDLRHLTMIVSRYGVPGQATGAVGVVGPTHLNYGRAISAVSYVSSVMTNMMAALSEQDDKPADDAPSGG